MRIFLDTNVLISAFVFAGKAGNLLEILFDNGYDLLISEYADLEFKAKLEENWSSKADRIYSLYRSLPFIFCTSTEKRYDMIRDKKDIPVLSDALFHNADIILTGDKDFLESDLKKPLIFSPTMLYDYLINLL
ncbi:MULTISPECIES: putative toxin-antitoxin system toxin component, PIN family [unclassified Treponema]|uniref:putative toxin-antitoxin system toxin component, PIN family n=1 Tax=unclassified Treponema TaxID=2638727 RepID=UPI0020A2396B|nr:MULTISPECIES: putative toxin-antitoxin system toxin component, PIN family [unclassified Treponema]UTC66808.1 putative toxin-antitoxin system toxin component, PIN family [Treponema sp. OMZ 789]UTC69540.1 putative toxin-antitoxin system toxin component, PIN family [Treponema sp. OMZ 790]UTC72253.1 putative toxin-antitoxin system toxin component, PIN family [Treponema sp. OMZ 791]